MNLLDIAVLAVLVLFVLHGIYRGFLPTLLSIGAYILAWLVAIVLLPVGSNAIRSNEKLFNTMLYYTEGSEYVGNVELSKTNINEISTDTLNDVFSNADLPYPVAKNIADNIAKETPTDAEFTDNTKWKLKFEHKNVRMGKISIPKANFVEE